METARKILAAFVVLALSIAIPASFSAAWFIYALWIAVGIAAVAWIALSERFQQKIPWELRRKDPQSERVLVRVVAEFVFRRDLQAALRTITETENPTLAELRPFAENLAERLRNEGYSAMAARVEVQLPDNAPQSDVRRRRNEIRDELAKSLIWDNYT